MYKLKTSYSFDSAHFLAGYNGKCSNIHGHRWEVILTVMSEDLKEEGQERGMCVDFGQIKYDLKEMLDYYDHSLIIEKGSIKEKTKEALLEENFRIIEVDFRPTAESFSKLFFDKMEERGYEVFEVCVYETPNNCASYSK